MIFQEEDEGQWPSYCLPDNKFDQEDDDGVLYYFNSNKQNSKIHAIIYKFKN